MPSTPISVLFVCLGNICRSPLAEGIFRAQMANGDAGHAFLADSAGTSAWHIGDPPDRRSVETAARHGIDISYQRARQISPGDSNRFDVVLAMDADNLAALRSFDAALACHRLLDFAAMPDEGMAGNVPDPYYGGNSGFDDVYRLLWRAMPRVIGRLAASSDAR